MLHCFRKWADSWEYVLSGDLGLVAVCSKMGQRSGIQPVPACALKICSNGLKRVWQHCRAVLLTVKYSPCLIYRPAIHKTGNCIIQISCIMNIGSPRHKNWLSFIRNIDHASIFKPQTLSHGQHSFIEIISFYYYLCLWSKHRVFSDSRHLPKLFCKMFCAIACNKGSWCLDLSIQCCSINLKRKKEKKEVITHPA